ncbi:MAG: hypothetical protein ACYC7E_15725 [Armatimonadota bacterium]
MKDEMIVTRPAKAISSFIFHPSSFPMSFDPKQYGMRRESRVRANFSKLPKNSKALTLVSLTGSDLDFSLDSLFNILTPDS